MYHGWKIIVYSVTGYPYSHFAELLNIINTCTLIGVQVMFIQKHEKVQGFSVEMPSLDYQV